MYRIATIFGASFTAHLFEPLRGEALTAGTAIVARRSRPAWSRPAGRGTRVVTSRGSVAIGERCDAVMLLFAIFFLLVRSPMVG